MDREIKSILKKLEENKIKVHEAVDEIYRLKSFIIEESHFKKAKKIKIHIVNHLEGTKIKIPGIPFWLVNSMVSLGFGLLGIVEKYVNNIDEEVKLILENIDREDLKEIINELKKHGPFKMVEIKEGENTEVNIEIV